MATRKNGTRRRGANQPAPVTAELIDERSEDMSDEESGLMGMVTPMFGVAAGTLAATKGADLVGVPAKWAPWGVAAIGTVGALTTKGWVREAAIGVAAAGAGIGILRMMGMLDPGGVPAHRNAPALVESPAQTPSAPPDAISREELQKALSEAAQENETRLKAALDEHREQLRHLRTAYDGRIEQLAERYEQVLADKDQTISDLLRELRRTQDAAPDFVPRDTAAVVEDAPVTEPSVAEAPIAEASAEESVAEAPAQPEAAPTEAVSKAQAIVDMLTHEEYAELKQLVATASPHAVEFAERQIANMTAEDAVAWLRANVLTAARKAA